MAAYRVLYNSGSQFNESKTVVREYFSFSVFVVVKKSRNKERKNA